MEKQYGTVFMFALSFWIQLLGTAMHIGYIYLRMYVLPANLGGNAVDLAFNYYAGYSIVLFGIIMI